jgi:hypothetical protein
LFFVGLLGLRLELKMCYYSQVASLLHSFKLLGFVLTLTPWIFVLYVQ